MKLLGSLLLMWSAGICCILQRKESRQIIQLMEAVLQDLAVLKRRVCTSCVPLPQLLEMELAGSFAGKYLWNPLLKLLQEEKALPQSWKLVTENMSPPLGRILAPMGPMLSHGGTALDRVIDETREELTRLLRIERQNRATADKLAAALYLSGASLVILVLI